MEADGRASRLSAKDLNEIFTDYNRTFITVPDSEFETMEVFPQVNSGGRSWGVDLDLFTVEEGRSDLTLQLRVHDTDNGIVVQIDNLHTL